VDGAFLTEEAGGSFGLATLESQLDQSKCAVVVRELSEAVRLQCDQVLAECWIVGLLANERVVFPGLLDLTDLRVGASEFL